MTYRFDDRVKVTTAAPGTGVIPSAAAALTGFLAFGSISGITTGDIIPYSIWDGGANWEDGFGTWTSGTGLTRTTVTRNSAGTTSKINFTVGVTAWCSAHAATLPLLDNSGNLHLATYGEFGQVGIGMVPVNILDITQNLNGVARAELLNSSAGSAAVTQWSAYNSSAICNFGITGSGFTPSGALGANTGFLTASGPLSVFTSLSNTLSLGSNSTTRMTIDPTGFVSVPNTATASIAANNTSGAAGNASSPCYIRCQQTGSDIAIMGDAYDVIGSAFRSDDGAFVARNNLYLGCGAGKNIEIYQGTTQLGYFDASTGNFVSNYKVFGDAGLGITNGELTITGFGDTTTFDLTGSILTNSGSGVEVQCVSGGVILNSGATSWAAVSDYRRKIDYGWFQDSGRVIDAVPVHLAQYKDGITARPMFLAHEVAQGGAGFAVKGEKDAVDDKGEPIYQTLESTDPLVAILWAEVRDLRKRLAALGG